MLTYRPDPYRHACRAVKPSLGAEMEAEIATEGQEVVRAKSLSTPGGKNAANKAFDGTPVQCSLGQVQCSLGQVIQIRNLIQKRSGST